MVDAAVWRFARAGCHAGTPLTLRLHSHRVTVLFHRVTVLLDGGLRAQGATQAPLQRVVEYGQAAAAKASEQAQAAYECALY